jgi:hypothetical protein
VARLLAIDAPRHITQRGDARQAVFEGDAGRYLLRRHWRVDRLRELTDDGNRSSVPQELPGYGRMSNHVHPIGILTHLCRWSSSTPTNALGQLYRGEARGTTPIRRLAFPGGTRDGRSPEIFRPFSAPLRYQTRIFERRKDSVSGG